MKIIYFANSRIPTEKAHGLQIIKMCEAFAIGDNQVGLILPNRVNREYKRQDIFDYYQVKKIFSVVKIFSPDPIFLLRFTSGAYIKLQSLFFSLSIFMYLSFKKDKKSYIFYTRDEHLLPVIQLFSKKVVWEAHNFPKNNRFYLKYWQRCQKIVTITEELKKILVKNGLPSAKILVAADGVDLEEFAAVTDSAEKLKIKLGLPLDKKIIMYTGHLYDWKGADILAKAADRLSHNALIVFIGGMTKDIQKFKEKYQASQNLLFLGFQSHEMIPHYLKTADVLVLPNSAKTDISNLYTSPLKLFEYLAAGRPMVASDLPSLREVLNQNNSILVEPDDAEALAAGINFALQNVEFSVKISKQSLIDAQKYTWRQRAKNIVDFIDDAGE